MERCHGRTKSGERCKRSAPEGSLYCGLHVDQEAEELEDTRAEAEVAAERDLFETVVVVAAAGIALWLALAFRRIFRVG